MLFSETVNEIDSSKYEFSSDSKLAALLTVDHVVVETGACFDDDKVYTLNTVFGVYDKETGEVNSKV